jgi:hypothetical protein
VPFDRRPNRRSPFAHKQWRETHAQMGTVLLRCHVIH